MNSPHTFFLALGVLALNVGCRAAAPAKPAPNTTADLVFPPDARVVNVLDYGAKPDDGGDDTEALQKAIAQNIGADGRYSRPRIIYLPSGTYELSAPLESRVATTGWSLGWRAGLVLMGQNREKTILKLRDNTPAYSDPAKPLAMIKTGSEYAQGSTPKENGGGNQAFRHEIVNLTLDTGQNNPGAVGLDYVANNRGTITDVTIRSGDGSGVCGLLLTREWPGPALVKRVLISGFDFGIRASHYQYSMTFEHLKLENQNKAGVLNTSNALFFRDLSSQNRVPAVVSSGDAGLIVLLDSKLEGGAGDAPALQGKARFFVRDTQTSGYASLLEDAALQGEEIASPRVHRVGEGAATSLQLPVEEAPEFHSNTLEDWANVEKFGAKADDGLDDADAIQKAIDAGKPIVYLPNGQYHVSKTLVVRGPVRKIVGMQAAIVSVKDAQLDAMIRFEGASETILERMRLGKIEHAGKGALVLRHLDHSGYRNTPEGTGKLFVEDVIGKPYRILHPQKVWMRQVNTEFGETPHIENRGGDVWLLGWKTEGQMTALHTVGGRVEIVGGLFYPLRKVAPDVPIMLNEGGQISASYVDNGVTPYNLHLRDVQGGQTVEVLRAEIPRRGPALLRVGAP